VQEGLRFRSFFVMNIVGSCANPLTMPQNLEAWEEAKKKIDEIPDHPNSLSSSANSPVAMGGTEGGVPLTIRRDSSATVNGR
jgi:hypothetical protein